MRAFRKAFTLIELLVVIAIIALLVSILLPSLNRAKALAKKTVCMSQLKGIGLCAMMYADSNNDCLPVAIIDYPNAAVAWRAHWFNLLAEYAGEKTTINSYDFSEIFKACPEYNADAADDWCPGYGVVIPLYSMNGKAPTNVNDTEYLNWVPKEYAYGTLVNSNNTGNPAYHRFYKRAEFSDSTRRGWMGESPQWHIGGGPDTTPYEPDNNLWPTWNDNSNTNFNLGRDPERHVESSNIWFLDGHAKDYKYDVGGNAFYNIEKLPF